MTREHRVRIIGGRWKRTPLPVPDVEGLRPSPDRVRETLFNWLGELNGIDCLDLFAGSGALGLEAASRGATSVLLVERDRRACALIRSVLTRLAADQVTLEEGDAMVALAKAARRGRRFGLVFLDPPFHQSWLQRVLPGLLPLLTGDARLYIESEQPLDVGAMAAWPGCAQPLAAAGRQLTLLRSGKAGQVHYHLVGIEPADLETPA